MSIQSTAKARASRLAPREKEEAFGPKPGTPIQPPEGYWEPAGRRSNPVFGRARQRVRSPEKSAPTNIGPRQYV